MGFLSFILGRGYNTKSKDPEVYNYYHPSSDVTYKKPKVTQKRMLSVGDRITRAQQNQYNINAMINSGYEEGGLRSYPFGAVDLDFDEDKKRVRKKAKK